MNSFWKHGTLWSELAVIIWLDLWTLFLNWTIFFVLGGWTTLSHFLARNGGDPNHVILPDELLPLDTKAVHVSPRKRASSTHTLVIPTHQHHHSNHAHQSNVQRTPTTPTPTFNRFVAASTPTSRRSSVSSPEPSIGSSSSGYSSNGVNGDASSFGTNDSILDSSTSLSNSTRIPIHRRRRIGSVQLTSASGCPKTLNPSDSAGRPNRISLSRSTSSNGISGSTLDLLANRIGSPISQIPRSNTDLNGYSLKQSRYPNYLNSSQHITGRMVGASSLGTTVNVSLIPGSTPTPSSNGSSSSPTINGNAKQSYASSIPTPVRPTTAKTSAPKFVVQVWTVWTL